MIRSLELDDCNSLIRKPSSAIVSLAVSWDDMLSQELQLVRLHLAFYSGFFYMPWRVTYRWRTLLLLSGPKIRKPGVVRCCLLILSFAAVWLRSRSLGFAEGHKAHHLLLLFLPELPEKLHISGSIQKGFVSFTFLSLAFSLTM